MMVRLHLSLKDLTEQGNLGNAYKTKINLN